MGHGRSIATLDLVGGTPALDLANTINSRHRPEHDYLRSTADLVEWAGHAGLFSADERDGLATGDPGDAADEQGARVIRTVLRLREAIYRTFSARAAGAPPAPDDVRLVADAYAAAISAARFDAAPVPGAAPGPGAAVRPSWPVANGAGTALLHRLAFDAGELLLDPAVPIGECPSCGWLFLDRSRNGSRRWCDMQTCGSRDKMRSHRARAATARPRQAAPRQAAPPHASSSRNPSGKALGEVLPLTRE